MRLMAFKSSVDYGRIHAYAARDRTYCGLNTRNTQNWNVKEGDEDQVTCIDCNKVLSGKPRATLIKNKFPEAKCGGCRATLVAGERFWYLASAPRGKRTICTNCQPVSDAEIRRAVEQEEYYDSREQGG